MVVINFCRFVLDLVFLLVLALQDKANSCFENDLVYTLIYLFFATIVTHFLPIGVIIKVYHPEDNSE